MANTQPSYLIILVHGTFASQAPWTSADSEFCRQLAATMDGPVQFEIFNWSGKNSHKARIKAGEELALALCDYSSSPAAKIIIAHSHGGNVAVYALRELGEDAASFQLVTLATPFLNVTKRDYDFYLGVNLFMVPLMTSALLLAATAFAFHFYIKQFTIPALIAAFLLCIFLFKKIWRSLMRFEKRVDQKSGEALRKLSVPEPDFPYPVLTVIDKKDEIRSWFRALSYCWETIMKVQRWVFNYSFMLVGFLVVYGIISMVYDIFFNPFYKDGVASAVMTYSSIIFAGCVGLVILFVSVSLAVHLIFRLTKSNVAALGSETIFDQLFLKTIPSPSPPFSGSVMYYEHSSRFSSLSLKHSIYNDPFVNQVIADWTQRRTQWELKDQEQHTRTIPQVFSRMSADPLFTRQLIKLYSSSGFEDIASHLYSFQRKQLASLGFTDVTSVTKSGDDLLTEPNTIEAVKLRQDAASYLLAADRTQEALAFTKVSMQLNTYDAEEFINSLLQYNTDYFSQVRAKQKETKREAINARLAFWAALAGLILMPILVLFARHQLLYTEENFAGQYIEKTFFYDTRKWTLVNYAFEENMEKFLWSLMACYIVKAVLVIILFLIRPIISVRLWGQDIVISAKMLWVLAVVEAMLFGSIFGYHPFSNFLGCCLYFSIASLSIASVLATYFERMEFRLRYDL